MRMSRSPFLTFAATLVHAAMAAQDPPIFRSPSGPVDKFQVPAVPYGEFCPIDLEGDGYIDVALPYGMGTGLGGPPLLWRNVGNGQLVAMPSIQHPALPGAPCSMSAGDVDGDGDADLLVTRLSTPIGSGEQPALYLNDGAGRLTLDTTGRLPTAPVEAVDSLLVDVDGDRDLDLVLAVSYGGGVRLCRNDGSGRFIDVTASQLPFLRGESWELAAGDLDGDGDVDLAVANGMSRTMSRWFDEPQWVLLNDGRGVFHQAAFDPVAVFTSGVEIGDVDGDGDLDLLFVGGGPNPGRLYLNNGRASFKEVFGNIPRGWGGQPRFLDADGDGDLDLLELWVGTPVEARLNRNDGKGRFVRYSRFLGLETIQTSGQDLLVNDMDGDADPDLVVGTFTPQPTISVCLNLRRQLLTPLTPLPSPGLPYTAEVYAYPNDVVIPALGLGAARIPLPGLGTLQLDPAQTFFLNAVTVGPSRRHPVTITIPNLAELRGRTLYWQGLHIDVFHGRTNHLTNCMFDRIQ